MLGLTAAALVSGSASAADVLHIAGSTAYRVAVTGAIINYLGGSGNVKAAFVGSADNQKNLFGAAQAIFESADGSQIVKTDWTGSLAGVVDVVQNNTTLKWFPTTQTMTTITVNIAGSNGTNATGGTAVASIASPELTAPEVAMSDAYFTSVAASISTAPGSGETIGNNILNAAIAPAGTGADSNNDRVGIVPFGWWLGNVSGTASGATNITQQVAYALTQSPVPVTFLTGNASQKNAFFYLVGRNEDSGTRIAALTESQGANISYNNTTAFNGSVIQNQIQFVGGTGADANGNFTSGTSVSGINLFPEQPLNTEPSIEWTTLAHTGYISGGNVASVLGTPNPTTGLTFGTGAKASENTGAAYLLGYLGWADGYGITSTGHTPLQYNGVTLSAANIQNGTYSFFTFEHMYYLTDSSPNAINVKTSNNQAIADGIADLVFSTFACTDSLGNTATASYPVASSTVDANEDQLTVHDSAAPAGLLIDSSVLVKRTIEGGPYSLTY